MEDREYNYDDPQTFSELLTDYKKRMEWLDWKFLWVDKKFHELLKLISSGEYKQMSHEEIVDRIALNITIDTVDDEPLDDVFEIEKKFNTYYYDDEGNPKY